MLMIKIAKQESIYEHCINLGIQKHFVFKTLLKV